jgi:type II secretory pathway pseudopilin PulG
MEQTVLFNKKGVTLIEMMISLLLIMIVFLALMQTTVIGISANLQNSLRDEAVGIAEIRMNQLKSLSFTDSFVDANLGAGGPTTEVVVSRNIRGFPLNYTPTRTIADISLDSKQITIKIDWTYRNQGYSHTITSIMRKQQ